MKNDNVPQKVIDLMKADKFVDLCGITLDEIGPGYAKTSVTIQPFISIFDAPILFDSADQSKNTEEYSRPDL